jgi:hypothetical protein
MKQMAAYKLSIEVPSISRVPGKNNALPPPLPEIANYAKLRQSI